MMVKYISLNLKKFTQIWAPSSLIYENPWKYK
jgi:hypothetical protein